MQFSEAEEFFGDIDNKICVEQIFSFAKLNWQQELILRLYFLDGVTFEEISRHLHISKSYAREVALRGIRIIKHKLNAREDSFKTKRRFA